jgi:hypothetical protein
MILFVLNTKQNIVPGLQELLHLSPENVTGHDILIPIEKSAL